jgi:hypothetical protein
MNKRAKLALMVTLVLAVTAATVGLMVLRAQALPKNVVPVVWDKETCGECGMAVSEPRFAAQLQTRDGRVINFDDPGCLFIYVSRYHPAVRAVYFHRMDGEEWLNEDRVGFVPVMMSPMGYNLGAVPRDTPGSLSYAEALEKMRKHDQGDGRP